jgi:hypothetical protein
LEILTREADLPFFVGLSRSWIKVGSDAAGHHMDEFIFLVKHLPRAFSRTNSFTGMLNITGGEGSGKGTFIFCLKEYGGESAECLCHNLGRNYFHEKDTRGSEEVSPVLAGAVDKAVVYAEEVPERELNVNRIKPMVEHRGGSVNARWGGARKKDVATHVPTYTIFTTGNSEIRVPHDARGIKGKINELSPPYMFVNRGTARLENQVEADPRFAERVAKGDFDAEITALIRLFFPLVHGDVVKGRNFGPVPASVLRNEERVLGATSTEMARAALLRLTTPVARHRDGSNYKLVDEALRMEMGVVSAFTLRTIGVQVAKGQAKDVGGLTTLFRAHLWDGHGGDVRALRLNPDAEERVLAQEAFQGLPNHG